MKKLPIGADANGSPVFLPLDIVTEKLAFLGMTGSGKTYSATKLAELMMDAGAQIVAIDPVGVWRGLRMGGDFQLYIFGGQSGDFPLESTGGALVAELIVDRGISAVLDVSQFGTDTELRRFAYDIPAMKPRPDLAKQIEAARIYALEMALIAFVEDQLGRVPSDDEILDKSFHVSFSDTPLSTFIRDGVRLTQFFVWDRTHAVAYGFVDPKDLLALTIVRVAREEWPGALARYTAQWNPTKGDV